MHIGVRPPLSFSTLDAALSECKRQSHNDEQRGAASSVRGAGAGYQSLSLFQNSSHHPEPESSSSLRHVDEDDDFLRRRFLRGSTGAAAGDSIAMRTMLSK